MKRCGECEFFDECSKICYKLDPNETFAEIGGCPCYSATDKAIIKEIINKIKGGNKNEN